MGDDLDTRLVDWMAEHRPALDEYMAQEGSRAVHLEFIAAEGGELPTRELRLSRARGASARAWLRHLARALEACWDGGREGLADDLEKWALDHWERLEALELEERAVLERVGRGDPARDDRHVTLAAHMRLFAEAVGAVAEPDGRSGPELSRETAAFTREHASRLAELEAEARESWARDAVEQEPMTKASQPEADETRVAEAAAVWAHVRLLTAALAELLGPQTASTA